MLLLLIIALGVHAVTKRKVHITSNWTVTGTNARNFGIAILVLTFPLAFLAARALPLMLPESVMSHPIGGRLAIFSAVFIVVVLLALAFEDETPDRVNW